MSFIFGEGTGQTYEDIQRKRRIADSLLASNMRSTPRNVGEGLSAIGRALMYRAMDKKASEGMDRLNSEADALWGGVFGNGSGGYGGTDMPPAAPPAASTAFPVGSTEAPVRNTQTVGGVEYDMGSSAVPSKAEIADYIRKAAQARGIDPEIAVRVASSEGLNANPAEAWQSNVVKNGKRERSYGPFQLYIDGGLGNEFMSDTGLDPRDASTWQQQIDYSLDHASKNGWGAWYGARNIGLDNMAGIGGAPSGAPSNGMNATVQTLMGLASNPVIMNNPARAKVVETLLGQALQRPDPMRDIELETARLKLEQMRNPQPQTTDDIIEYERAKKDGYDGSFTDFMLGTRRAGATTINNNMGGGTDVNYGEPPKDHVWLRNEDGSIMMEPEPGGRGFRPVAVPIGAEARKAEEAAAEADTAARKESEKNRQGALKLGTSLTGLNLNIDNLENQRGVLDGDLPTTGAIGTLRKTWLGQALTGSEAVDFENRTKQITDAAALAEIQNMRDNSPTGGAVGSLTDGERVAIGNAVTALNGATSREEYLRAARAYRKLALDLAMKDANGQVIPYEIDDYGNVVVDGQVWFEMDPDGVPYKQGSKRPEAKAKPQTFEEFAADPDVKAKADQYGVTPKEMWDMRNELREGR